MFFLRDNVKEVWSVAGIRVNSYVSACINEQPWPTKTCCDSYQWKNAGNLFRGRPFLSSLFATFPYPHPCCVYTHSPHTGQQEIGIQCFLDDFLKEMNLLQKMRTMNNGTPDGMCLTHVIHPTCAAAEGHVWNRRLGSQGCKEPRVEPLLWGETNGFLLCTYNHLI